VKFRVEVVVHVHNRGHVAASITVIRSRPDGDDRAVFEMPFEAFVDQLMCTGDELKTVDMVEFRGNFISK
jgi:hypothetical protein